MYQEKENILPAMKAIAKTASSYIPVVNCAINFYEEKKSQVVQRKLQRLGDFCQSLLERLKRLESDINEDYIRKDDFEDIFEQTANYLMNEFREEKRRCFHVIRGTLILRSDRIYQ